MNLDLMLNQRKVVKMVLKRVVLNLGQFIYFSKQKSVQSTELHVRKLAIHTSLNTISNPEVNYSL